MDLKMHHGTSIKSINCGKKNQNTTLGLIRQWQISQLLTLTRAINLKKLCLLLIALKPHAGFIFITRELLSRAPARLENTWILARKVDTYWRHLLLWIIKRIQSQKI